MKVPKDFGVPEMLAVLAEETSHFAQRFNRAYEEAARRRQLRVDHEGLGPDGSQLELPFPQHGPANAIVSEIEDWDLTKQEWAPEQRPEQPPEPVRLVWD